MSIDLNRGVIAKTGLDGLRVYMYKDEPGIFRDVHGDEVALDAARTAGFDVKALSDERTKRERLDEARERIEREVAAERERLEAEERDAVPVEEAVADPEPEQDWPVGAGVEITARNDKGRPRRTNRREMRFLGVGKTPWQVFDLDGNEIAPPMKMHDAERLLLEAD